jgi:hypothetical protein
MASTPPPLPACFALLTLDFFHKLLWFLEKPRNEMEMGHRDLSGLQKDKGLLRTKGETPKHYPRIIFTKLS